MIVVLPLLYDFRQYPFADIHNTMRTLGETEGIHVLDLLPAFQELTASDLWVHAIDHHPNEVGHQRIAEEILDYLEQNSLLKTSAH